MVHLELQSLLIVPLNPCYALFPGASLQGRGLREARPDGSSLTDQVAVLCAPEFLDLAAGMHRPTAVIGNPGLFRERPGIAAQTR